MSSLKLETGNGHGTFPVSRKTLLRHLPRRLGTLEDQVESCERRLSEIAGSAASTELTALAVRFDNLAEIVGRLTATVRRIDRRSARSRRRVAVIADQLAD
jgi:hypothetical protein